MHQHMSADRRHCQAKKPKHFDLGILNALLRAESKTAQPIFFATHVTQGEQAENTKMSKEIGNKREGEEE